MRKQIYTKLLSCAALSLTLMLLVSCSAGQNNAGTQFGAREYYDYYSDRPGYMDFRPPVIFMPDEGPAENQVELKIEE
ncbi:MAG: hypothetical protein HKP41_21865 [Desulfobacterales bacterium]|nr:hypothetical protein [Deltaproteobacteria bacterium]NNK97010.1 hypothetical protein [Desulfobacterales bacterium]